jgi:hypothetical protein
MTPTSMVFSVIKTLFVGRGDVEVAIRTPNINDVFKHGTA